MYHLNTSNTVSMSTLSSADRGEEHAATNTDPALFGERETSPVNTACQLSEYHSGLSQFRNPPESLNLKDVRHQNTLDRFHSATTGSPITPLNTPERAGQFSFLSRPQYCSTPGNESEVSLQTPLSEGYMDRGWRTFPVPATPVNSVDYDVPEDQIDSVSVQGMKMMTGVTGERSGHMASWQQPPLPGRFLMSDSTRPPSTSFQSKGQTSFALSSQKGTLITDTEADSCDDVFLSTNVSSIQSLPGARAPFNSCVDNTEESSIAETLTPWDSQSLLGFEMKPLPVVVKTGQPATRVDQDPVSRSMGERSVSRRGVLRLLLCCGGGQES